MADDGSPDYKALFQKAEAERRQEAELRRQEAEARTQSTAFGACYDLFSQPCSLTKTSTINCMLFGACGLYGALFKVTCAVFDFMVVGKGTMSKLWKEVSSEVEIY
jgi:hypothetical protein